jgi:hypothetical protein
MDYRFDRIRSHLEGCLREAGVFERAVEGAQLFDVDIVEKEKVRWLAIGAGISESESIDYFRDAHKRERATIPIQVTPHGHMSILLVVRAADPDLQSAPGKYVVPFSTDVEWVELRQGCYVRVDDLENPAVRQVRWELDPVTGHQPPQEQWLRPWARIVGCNPAHAPSHWHLNSPPIERPGRRGARRAITPPELRLATGLPSPLLLLLSLGNWLRLQSWQR